MTGYLHTVTKKPNSTALPAGAGTSVSFVLKGACSVQAPVLLMKNRPAANYIYIPDFGRYYWIRDISYEVGEWSVSCVCDVLATYKSEIGSSIQYVLRSASSYDGTIIDSLYPMKTAPEHAYNSQVTGMNQNVSGIEGCFSVAILGASPTGGQAFGAQYYLMPPAAFQELINWMNTSTTSQLFASDLANAMQVLVEDVAQSITRIQDYILNAVWLPMPASGSPLNQIYLGFYAHTMTNQVYQATRQELSLSWQFTVPAHPDAATRGAWLNSSAYTQHSLYLPGVGIVSVSSDDLGAGATLQVLGSISCVDGSISYSVSGYPAGQLHGTRLGVYYGSVGVRVPMSVTMSDPISAGVSAALAAESLTSGNFIGAAAGIQDAAGSFLPSTRVIGGASGMHAAFGPGLYSSNLMSRFWRPVDEDLASHGRPLCSPVQLSTLSGYILCENAEISTSGTQAENEEIMSYLNGGFYYE